MNTIKATIASAAIALALATPAYAETTEAQCQSLGTTTLVIAKYRDEGYGQERVIDAYTSAMVELNTSRKVYDEIITIIEVVYSFPYLTPGEEANRVYKYCKGALSQ